MSVAKIDDSISTGSRWHHRHMEIAHYRLRPAVNKCTVCCYEPAIPCAGRKWRLVRLAVITCSYRAVVVEDTDLVSLLTSYGFGLLTRSSTPGLAAFSQVLAAVVPQVSIERFFHPQRKSVEHFEFTEPEHRREERSLIGG